MLIRTAEFIISNTNFSKCPAPDRPEFAFIGRSNVGKSSVINMLVNRKDLAKTSSKPGKTQTINHFLVNDQWYLVDLPGYGYAGVSRDARKGWGKMIESYLLKRENLFCTFVLIDSRHQPQPSDLSFLQWLGERQIPLAIILTKSDKLSRNDAAKAKSRLTDALTETWEEFPPIFLSSAEKKVGRDDILKFIENAIRQNG